MDPKTIREEIEDLDAEIGEEFPSYAVKEEDFYADDFEDYEPNPYDGTYSEE